MNFVFQDTQIEIEIIEYADDFLANIHGAQNHFISAVYI